MMEDSPLSSPIYASSLEVDSNDREIIRETIIDKVNSILWLDSLVADENLYQERLAKAKASTEKCMICTLPYGTCKHTREWISESYERRTRIPDDEDLDKTIDDMLSVIGDFKLETKPSLEDIDLDGMQWKTLEQRPTDRIGSTNVCLFSPDERGWHSTVKLSANLVLVFAGLKYRVSMAPPLFTAEPTQEEVEFLNDIRAYDTQNLAWYGVRARGKKNGERDLAAEAAAEEEGSMGSTEQRYLQPEGRYGHIAAALDENRMLIFGGRGAGGRNLRDTWIYHYDADSWEQVHVNEELQLPLPRARYFSACVSVPIPPLGQARTTSSIACQLKETDRDVYMFGGTSGTEYFGDLWVFRGSASMLRWEPLIAVGIPPSPRFGHQMVVLFDEKGVEANHYQNGGQQLMVLGGCTFRPVADMVGRNLVPAELSHQVHTIAGSMQATRKEKLAEAHMDVYVLSITELIWRSTAYPGIKGTLPTARMHFSAACISHHVFVFGGLDASALRYNPAEQDGQTAVFVLDMSTMRWRIATATNSPDHLKEPLRIAQADVIRALRRCDEEKLRGLSLGALNGKTIELAEAQAVLEVCRWRQSVLQSEQLEHTSAPPARWGATLLAHGQRVLYIGGWEQYTAVPKGKSVVLNVEQEHERRRRLDDEYSAKLQRDRIRDQAEANMANVQSIYELRAIRKAELDSQTREAKAMTTEDLLSSLPPLFLPEPVKLVKANQHTIWIKWHRIMRNSKRQLLDPDTITYFVYMRVGFENFILGDRVFATVPPTQSERSSLKSSQHRRHNRPQASAYNVRTVFFDDECKRYPAEITRASGCGKFDLLFDDGTVEKEVPRHRLKLAPPLDLSAVLPSLLSRPNTATTPRAGTANSATGSRLGSPQRSTVSATDERRSLPSSPGRSRAHSPYTSRPDTAGNNQMRTDTAATSVSTTQRASVGAALMAASTKASASMGALSVVPLEFAAAMRNRIQHRQRQRDRALHQIDKAFRGVRELTEEEIAEMNRQSKRSRRQQLRSGTASTLTCDTLDSMITPVGRRSPSGGLSATGRMSPTTTKREQTAVTFGDPTNLDDLFSFGEPVPPSQYENEPLTICVAEPQTTGPKLTVKVDPCWQLVYVGNDNDCSVTHLVPEGVLEREPDIRVPVSFCYQVHGADEPYYEHSRLSAPVVFFTQPPPSKTVTVSKATAKGVNRTAADSAGTAGTGTMSKMKKEIITAVVAGQQIVQIEKLGDSCRSYGGLSDHYL